MVIPMIRRNGGGVKAGPGVARWSSVVQSLPDLVLRAEELRVLADPEALPLANLAVHNEGLREATSDLVGVHDALPSATTAPEVSTTVHVPVGCQAAVSLPIDRSGFCLEAGWNSASDDRTFADNLLWSARCYLPLVLRRQVVACPPALISRKPRARQRCPRGPSGRNG